MKNSDDFKMWADGIYNSMNDAQRATPTPFLLTRVLQSNAPQKTDGVWEMISYWLTKPSVAFTILFFVVLLNIVLITGTGNMQFKRSENPNDYFTTSITSIYDVENITP